MNRTVVSLALVSLSLLPGLAKAQTQYKIQDLGIASGANRISVTSLNSKGETGGHFSYSTYDAPFLYTSGYFKSVSIDAKAKSTNISEINENLDAVGIVYLSTSSYGFSINNGVTTRLPGIVAGTSMVPSGINNYSDVVGKARNLLGRDQAVLFSNGQLTPLAGLGGPFSLAVDVNDNKQIVGNALLADGRGHAVLWSNGTVKDLGTLVSTAKRSAATGINNVGVVIGQSNYGVALNYFHAFKYENGRMVDLGTLGGVSSCAYGINDLGDIVGTSYIAGNTAHHAFLWSNGTIKNLNSLIPSGSGWVLNQAVDINQNGQILGYGTKGGKVRAFLLIP